MTGLRVATLSHGHPRYNAGGAEIAALTLHHALADRDDITALHIAPGPVPGTLGTDQRILGAIRLDPLLLANSDPSDLEPLIAVLRDFAPDVVHLHHILGFGTGALFAIRAALPDAAVVLTLHEYIAICHNRGQMVTTDGELCLGASPERCNACFPDIAPGRFLRRERALQAALSLCDAFVAPSAFLARRYVDWGLPAGRITVLENVIASSPQPPIDERTRRGRFAFFGQFTSFKGLDVLLAAVASVPEDDWTGCTLAIHGDNLEGQPGEFQARFHELLGRAGTRVSLHGPYTGDELPGLMADVDWVVVPSIWWENSPVVIQEAFRAGRPVIAADIGGMAEKVRHGIDGLNFRARDPAALARRLIEARDPALWTRLRNGIRPPASPADAAAAHLALYRSLLARRPRALRAAG